MRTLCTLLLVLLLAGCSTALKREGQCLASLAPEFLQTRDELAQLEEAWRESLVRRRAEPGEPTGLAATTTDSPLHPVNMPGAELTPVGSDRTARQQPAPEAGRDAYARLVEARMRHRTTVGWYEKVYARFRTRLDEEEILSQTLMVLVTSPALVFYPLIRWNIRSVFWDGTDPDAESDPVTKYCRERLSAEASADARTREPSTDGSVLPGDGPASGR